MWESWVPVPTPHSPFTQHWFEGSRSHLSHLWPRFYKKLPFPGCSTHLQFQHTGIETSLGYIGKNVSKKLQTELNQTKPNTYSCSLLLAVAFVCCPWNNVFHHSNKNCLEPEAALYLAVKASATLQKPQVVRGTVCVWLREDMWQQAPNIILCDDSDSKGLWYDYCALFINLQRYDWCLGVWKNTAFSIWLSNSNSNQTTC